MDLSPTSRPIVSQMGCEAEGRDVRRDVSYEETKSDVADIIREMGGETSYVKLKIRDGVDEPGSCFNVHEREDGTVVPGCIVGQYVVKKLGVDPIDIRDGDGVSGNALKSTDSEDLANWLVADRAIHLDDESREFLFKIQASQDSGKTWQESFERAVRHVEGG